LAPFAPLRESSFIRSSPFRAKTLPNDNPNSEARNPKQTETLKSNYQNPKRDHLDLFRFSDFVLLLLFVFGVLCAFAARPVEYLLDRKYIGFAVKLFHGASPVEYRLDQDRVVRPKRYSTGRVIVYPIP